MSRQTGRIRLSGQQRWYLTGYRLGLPFAAFAVAEQAFRYTDTIVAATKWSLTAVLIAFWLLTLWRPVAALGVGVWVVSTVVWSSVAEACCLLVSDRPSGVALAREIGYWVPIICVYWAMILYARPRLVIALVVLLNGLLLAVDFYARNTAGGSVLNGTLMQSVFQMVVLIIMAWIFSGAHGKVISQRNAARTTAVRDPLTGLHNRWSFEHELRRIVHQADREGDSLCLIVVDIDHFKHFNDRYGHLAGDSALKIVAGICRQTLRRTDLMCRWGGEEFAVILPHADAASACRTAEKLRQAVAEHRMEGGEPLTISCGVAKHNSGELPRNLFEHADAALLQAKALGRNQVTCCPLADYPTMPAPT
jgi:diguanylate cyclase (GGDEF)-like protein